MHRYANAIGLAVTISVLTIGVVGVGAAAYYMQMDFATGFIFGAILGHPIGLLAGYTGLHVRDLLAAR